MKNTIQTFSLFTVTFALFLFSCKNNPDNNNCSSNPLAPVTKVDGSKIGTASQPMPFIVYFPGNSGCAQSGVLTESVSGNTRTISVNVKYVGCVCTAIASVMQINYTFTPVAAGTYYLKFTQDNNTFLIDTLAVN
ncbi:MAG: hypothetical protein ACHQK8_05960 [Bacteroidia bacterium]